MNRRSNRTGTRRVFGTDGIRALLTDPIFSAEGLQDLGFCIGKVVSENIEGRPQVFMGRDTRASGFWIQKSIAQELMLWGIDSHDLGVVSTPEFAYLIKRQNASLGLMITASHNPAEYNGIKFFDGSGDKWTISQELAIEALLNQEEDYESPHLMSGAFQTRAKDGTYLDALRQALPKAGLQDWKIVVDCANGATTDNAADIFKESGAAASFIGIDRDGDTINDQRGSEFPQTLQKTVASMRADIGIAFDGDGDRVVFCDSSGALIPGDCILAFLKLYIHANQDQENSPKTGDLVSGENVLEVPEIKPLVTTQYANSAMDAFLRTKGIRVLRTEVGDRAVSQAMDLHDCPIGGEVSGHTIIRDHLSSGDGLFTALTLLKAIGSPQNVSQVSHLFTCFPSLQKNLKVTHKPKFDTLKHFQAALSKGMQIVQDRGRIFARYSGTEPMLRILIESESHDLNQSLLRQLEVALDVEGILC